MTHHLTKPIRAIHFMVLAFLMTLSSPVAAQSLDKVNAFAKADDYAVALIGVIPSVGRSEMQVKSCIESGAELLNCVGVAALDENFCSFAMQHCWAKEYDQWLSILPPEHHEQLMMNANKCLEFEGAGTSVAVAQSYCHVQEASKLVRSVITSDRD